MSEPIFIIDCPSCKAKVAAIEKGSVSRSGSEDEYAYVPFADKLLVGACPRCGELLAGISHQVDFAGFDAEEDRWSDIVRVYPKPPKTFLSNRIPRSAKEPLSEADRSLQANANIAACAMFGRALEAVCRDILDPEQSAETQTLPKKKIMLADGIKKLKDGGFIDDRLYDWSQQLHAFRNLAAHPDEGSISRRDAEDLQSFVYAIIEYVYPTFRTLDSRR